MMPRRPPVTACVPAWNAEAFIGKTLDSLAAQTYDNLRVIVSVDLSTDGTARLCEAYAARDTRFSVVSQPRRLGWVGNVNDLLRRADGTYCVFALHDDLLEPTFVSRLVEALESHPGAVVAFSDMDTTYQDGRVQADTYDLLDGVTDPVKRAHLIGRRLGQWWVPHRGLFRTEIGQRIGGLQRHLAGEFSADWPWLLHLALYGEFVRVPEILCHKHYMKASLSLTWKRSRWENLAVNLSCIREILRANVPLGLKGAVLAPFIGHRLARRLSLPQRS